jgi:hypothetical protein
LPSRSEKLEATEPASLRTTRYGSARPAFAKASAWQEKESGVMAKTRKTRAPRGIEEIKAQLGQLQARVTQLKALESTERRKQNTRLKIIFGETVLAAMGDDPQLASVVKKLLNERVTRENDRKVIAHLL